MIKNVQISTLTHNARAEQSINEKENTHTKITKSQIAEPWMTLKTLAYTRAHYDPSSE